MLIQECLSFLTFTSDSPAAERVEIFAPSAIEVIKSNSVVFKKFVKDAGGNFRPERLSLYPVTEK